MYTGPAVQVVLGCGVSLRGLWHGLMQCLERRLTLQSVECVSQCIRSGRGSAMETGHMTSGQGIGREVTLGIVDRLP